jgi:hypothetical protein
MQGTSKGEAAAKFASFCLGRYSAADGIDFLVDYANNSKTFSVEVFQSVCEQLREGKDAKGWRKPAAFDLVAAYKSRMANRVHKSRTDGESCGTCRSSGRLAIVVGGESPFVMAPVDPVVVRAKKFATISLLPCDCYFGRRMKRRLEKIGTGDGEGKFENCKELRRSFAFGDLREADDFAARCRQQWKEENGARESAE